jgi:hypothetical protein
MNAKKKDIAECGWPNKFHPSMGMEVDRTGKVEEDYSMLRHLNVPLSRTLSF